MATSPIGEDQGRLLEEALGVVRQQSHQMRKCLETPGKLMDALKCGYETTTRPLRELRTLADHLTRIAQHLCLSFAHPLSDPNSTTSFTWPSLMP